jgi:hypothetical protein
MIKARDLRIGNLVLYKNTPEKISGIVDVIHFGMCAIIGDDEPEIDLIDPIPLTEEWLIAAGLTCEVLSQEVKILMTDPPFIVATKDLDFWKVSIAKGVFDFGQASSKIQYIHELQNLYFAVRGTELEFKNLPQ